MIVNRRLEERLFIWVTMVLTSYCAASPAVLAQDRSQGWEQPSGADEIVPPIKDDKEDNTPPPAKKEEPTHSQGWNEQPRSNKPAEKTETAPTTATAPADLITAGDTALSAGQFAEALAKLDDAWRAASTTKQSAKTTAMFFERKAIALRGLQRLVEAERVLKQALGHATTGNAKDPDLQARILFELADLQSQEGVPRDGLASAKQAGGLAGENVLLSLEALNTESRLLTDMGDVKSAEAKLSDALAKADRLPATSDSSIPPQSAISKYGEYAKGKMKINQYYLGATKGSANKSALDEGLTIIKNYAPGMPVDTRYSPVLLQVEQDNFSSQSVANALATSSAEDLVKAALLLEQARAKEKSNDLKGALDAVKSCYDIRLKALPSNSSYVAEALVQSSGLNLKLGRSSDAATQAQRAVTALEKATGRKSFDFGIAQLALANVYIASSKTQNLETVLTEAFNVISNVKGSTHPEALHALDLLCSTYIRNRNYAFAEKFAETALSGSEKQFGPNSPRLVLSLTNLGTACAHNKKFSEANKYLERAQNIMARSGKSSTAEYADVLAAMGVSFTLQKKWAPAANSLKQARTIYATAYGAKSPAASQMTELLKTMEALKAGPKMPSQNLLLQNAGFKPTSPAYR